MIRGLVLVILLIASSKCLSFRGVTTATHPLLPSSKSPGRGNNGVEVAFLQFNKCFPVSNFCRLSAGRAPLNSEPLELCEENAVLVIEEVRRELGTIFGYDPMSRQVGITGEIDLVEVDGPTVLVSLRGRFWHATDTVMLRVESFVRNRIPEVLEVKLDLARSAIQDDNRLNTEGSGERRLF